MNYVEMEIRMMEIEDGLPEITAEFPVKGNRRETRRFTKKEYFRKRYGCGVEGKRASIVAHKAEREKRLAWATKKAVMV